MEERQAQIEALQMVVEYIKKLAPAFHDIAVELSGDKQDDTMDLLNQAIEGLNMVIEVFNATYSLLNEKEELFQKDVIEDKIGAMNKAISSRDDKEIAKAIEEGILPFITAFAQIADVFLKNNA